jgi:FemAB-related protein (PEP-CTERM system-associated)
MIEKAMPLSAVDVDVREFQPADAQAWERFVLEQPQGTVFHRLAWSQAVEQAYGHRPRHLTAWLGQRLVGVLPMFVVDSLLAGRVLVSLPYATYGGIVADSPPAASALLAAAQDICRDEGCQYMELRHRESRPLDLPVIDRYDTFRKMLPQRAEQIIIDLPKRTRGAARKGMELIGENPVVLGPSMLGEVFGVYALTMRRLGSPSHRKRFFTAIQQAYGGECVLAAVRHKGRTIAGVLNLVFRDEFTPYFCGSTDEGQALQANNVLYLRLMEYAVGRGLRLFDFNRSRRENSGPYNFKKHHGFDPSPLCYQVFLNKAAAMPDLTPGSSRFALAQRIWRRLPLWMTKQAGGRISKWIP